jgi:hypothetical protein
MKTFFCCDPNFLRELSAFNLNLTDWKICLYLHSLAPFPDQWQELTVPILMEDLHIRSRGSVYPSLARLRELGLIDLDVGKFRYKTLRKNKRFPQAENSPSSELFTLTIDRSSDRSIDHSRDRSIARVINRPRKTPQSKASRTPKNLKNLKTLKIEREAFEFFLREKIKALPEKPVFPEKWIEKYLQDPTMQIEYLDSLKAKEMIVNSAAAPPVDLNEKNYWEMINGDRRSQ